MTPDAPRDDALNEGEQQPERAPDGCRERERPATPIDDSISFEEALAEVCEQDADIIEALRQR